MSIARPLLCLIALSLTFFALGCQSNDAGGNKKDPTVLAPESDKDAIRIAVTGQVPQPGYYTVSRDANIATVLVQAGWTPYFAKDKYEASPTIWIKRLSEGHQESWILPMDEIYDDKWMEFDLRDGDIINVMIILF